MAWNREAGTFPAPVPALWHFASRPSAHAQQQVTKEGTKVYLIPSKRFTAKPQAIRYLPAEYSELVAIMQPEVSQATADWPAAVWGKGDTEDTPRGPEYHELVLSPPHREVAL